MWEINSKVITLLNRKCNSVLCSRATSRSHSIPAASFTFLYGPNYTTIGITWLLVTEYQDSKPRLAILGAVSSLCLIPFILWHAPIVVWKLKFWLHTGTILSLLFCFKNAVWFIKKKNPSAHCWFCCKVESKR